MVVNIIVNTIMSVAPILTIIGIVMTLMSAFKWHVDKTATAEAADLMQGISENFDYTDYIDIDDNKNIVFIKDDQGRELKDVLIQNMNESGVSTEAMGLTSDNLIEDIINAEIVTNYPYLGGDGLQGIVNFYRRDYDAKEDEEGTLMTYVDKDEFNKRKKKFEKSGKKEDWENLQNVFYLEKQKGNSSGSNKGKGSFTKYDLTEEQLNGIASQCQMEQGTPKGAAAEASLMANRFELYGSSYGTGADGLFKYVSQSGWFAGSKSITQKDNASDEIKEAVRSVLIDGKRTLPGYVDEHVTFAAKWIVSATNDGVNINVTNRSAYIKNKTIIQQSSSVGGGKYTFYSFPDTNSDPFGYISEENRSKIGELYYDFETGQAMNGTEVDSANSSETTTIDSLNNFLFIGDSILGTLKSGLESEGAKAIYQVSANANFFLGQVSSPSSEGVCQRGQKFDWDSNIVQSSTPNGIYLVLGQNLCDGGATSYLENGINDIKSLVEKLQSQFPNVPIYINSVVPCSSGYSSASNYKDGMNKANELLENYCSSTNNVTYVNILNGYIDDGSGYAKEGMTSDGIHPTTSGATTLIDSIKNSEINDSGSTSSKTASSTINLVVATYKDVDGKIIVTSQKINYQIETSKYATPVEFLISHLQVSNDTKYVKAIADMVIHNSRIDYVIQDQYNETTVKEYETYTINTYTANKDDDGNVISMDVSSENVGPNVLSTQVTKAISIVSYIRNADTWIVKAQQKYVKKISGPTPSTSNERNLGDGDYNASTGKQIVNRKRWTETTVYSVTYVPVLTVSNSGNGANNGGNSNVILGDNEIANKILTTAENQLGIPYVYGGSTTSGFDCSGLVQYCCIQAGANVPPRTTGGYSSYSQYEVGWNDMQPGDVLWNESHVGIYIGDGKYIHAPQTGDVVKVSSLESRQSGSRKFTKVYRFW